MCIVKQVGRNERHEFLEDITRNLSLRIKNGSISFMKNFLPRCRQYLFKPFGILEHPEVPWISWCTLLTGKNKTGKKVCCTVYDFFTWGQKPLTFPLTSLGDVENSKHCFKYLYLASFNEAKALTLQVSCDNGEIKFSQYHKYLYIIFML